MPKEPIEYRVLRDIQAALTDIAVSAGYHHDIESIEAVKLDPDVDVEALVGPDGRRPFILLSTESETWDYGNSPEQQDSFFDLGLPITVHWVNDVTGTDDEARIEEFFRACADIEQAVGVDVTRGFLAVDTRIVRRSIAGISSTQVWVEVQLQVRIQRAFGQPNGA